MLISNEEQLLRKHKDKINEKIEDKKYYEEQLIPKLLEMREINNQKELDRLNNIKKYKEDLDKQIIENRKLKFGYFSPNYLNDSRRLNLNNI